MISLGVQECVGSPDVRRKSRRSSEVISELTEKSQSLPKKLVETHQEDHHEVQELTESPLEHCREIVGSSPEDHRKLAGRNLDLRTLFSLVNILKFIVST